MAGKRQVVVSNDSLVGTNTKRRLIFYSFNLTSVKKCLYRDVKGTNFNHL